MKSKRIWVGPKIVVGMATCGLAAGAKPIMDTFIGEINRMGLDVEVDITGCLGVCQMEPMADFIDKDGSRTTYVNLTPEKVSRIVREHLAEGRPCDDLIWTDNLDKQERIALRNIGIIHPEHVEEYIAQHGYIALHKCINELSPQQVIDEVKASGLCGRGGAGYPTGKKWEIAARSTDEEKIVCCNADEGNPGAFMDRCILEGDPHTIIEAMTIAGYAIGANQGYIYIRAEYPLAARRLGMAMEWARSNGHLGRNIYRTGFSFDIQIRYGAGAFICGEETALMRSIEGKRGEPVIKPPHPAEKGVFEKPTLLNNVETFANIPMIILEGGQWFSGMGTEKSKGTKVFSLSGKINVPGLVEVPMGTPLRDVIFNHGGGIPHGKAFKAVQVGGPAGGFIPASHLDIPLCYEEFRAIGSMLGAGGMIVLDEDVCMVDMAKTLIGFSTGESCGKCTPCRIGTKRMLEILERITEGGGHEGDLEVLEKLGKDIKLISFCGLGRSAPNPVLSSIRYFRDEFEEHIHDKKCRSKVCRALSGETDTHKSGHRRGSK